MRKSLLLSITIFILCSLCFAQADKGGDKNQKKPDKLTAEEVVAKHVASIGKPEDLAAVKSRVMVGEARYGATLGGFVSIKGTTQFASANNMVLLAIIFDNKDYPYEKAAFDGKDQTVGYPNGGKTFLAEFLKSQDAILKEGLFGGALSSAWPLLDLKSRNAKIEYGGTAEVEGRQAYKLKYSSRVGDMRVYLYFDAENFRHVRTEYQYSVQSKMGYVATDSSQSKPDYYNLTEDFSDFRTAGKLTLPLMYTINVTRQIQNLPTRSVSVPTGTGGVDVFSSSGVPGSGSRYWTIKIFDVYYNEALDAAVFKVS